MWCDDEFRKDMIVKGYKKIGKWAEKEFRKRLQKIITIYREQYIDDDRTYKVRQSPKSHHIKVDRFSMKRGVISVVSALTGTMIGAGPAGKVGIDAYAKARIDEIEEDLSAKMDCPIISLEDVLDKM